VHIFQQPDTGNTVHLRQVKRNLDGVPLLKFDQLFLQLCIVQIGVAFCKTLTFKALSGVFIQIIEFTQVVRIQNFINHLTALTTKVLVANMQAIIRTSIMAVKTA
jgi:hypothetical protein